MNWSNQIFLENTLSHLLAVSVIIILIFICRRWLSVKIASLLFIPIHEKWKSVDKASFSGLIISPLGNLLMVMISLFAIENLHYPKSWNIEINDIRLHDILISLDRCVIIFFLIRFLNRFIDFIALVLDLSAKQNHDKSDDQLIVFFRDFLKAIFYTIGFLLILKVGFRINVGSLLTGLSIVGAALALAAKESIENLIASFIIFFDKPFFTGDFVKINNASQTSGTIENIGLRSTRIRTSDHTLVTVPNKQMVDTIIDNWTMRNARKTELTLELDIQNENKKVIRLMDEIKLMLQGKSPYISEPQVHLFELHKNNMIIKIEYLTPVEAIEKYLSQKEEVNWFVKNQMLSLNLKPSKQTQDLVILQQNANS